VLRSHPRFKNRTFVTHHLQDGYGQRWRRGAVAAFAATGFAATVGLGIAIAAPASTDPANSKAVPPAVPGRWPAQATEPAPLPAADPDVCGSWSSEAGGTARNITAQHGELRNCGKFGSDWILTTVNNGNRPGAIGVRHCANDATCLDGRIDPGPHAFTWYTPAGLPTSAMSLIGTEGSQLIVSYGGNELHFDPATGLFSKGPVG
jgi:hypothetical protein